MSEICTDNRYEVIAAYKKKLIESTNIETSPEEMAVIDNVLFRFWQMGWLPPVPHGALIDRDDFFAKCPELVNGYKAITDDLVVVPAEEKEENFCADCRWHEAEEQYCFRKGCHTYDESSCELWEPMPADEPIPAPGGKTVPAYDLLHEEGGWNLQ